MTAAEFLVSQAAAAPGEITVLAIGPLSNLRKAVELDPAFAVRKTPFLRSALYI